MAFNKQSFSSNKRKIIPAVLFLILLISIPLGIYLVKQQQDTRSRASTPPRSIGYEAQKFRGIGFNSSFNQNVTAELSQKANGKWIRVLFYWSKAEPNPGEYKDKEGEYFGRDGEFDREVKFWKDKGFNVSAVMMGSPKWTNGWWEELSPAEKEKYGFADINALQENNGPLNSQGKERLTLLSQRLMVDFPRIDLWETRNEPNIQINGWRTSDGVEVSWHGFFGFNINNQGVQIKAIPGNFNESDYSLIGAKEYAEYQKAFYQGKINAKSQIPVSYAGSMWAFVGTHPSYVNSLDHNFDRWVFKYLKAICPENGCFDVMNFHYYNPGDGGSGQCQGRIVRPNPQPNAPSREDFFRCHEPYVGSILKGKIRRIKYDMQDILGSVKPLFTSEIGFAWNHDKNDSNYLNDVRGAQGGWIKQLTEARAEGVDGIIQYELGGTNNAHEGILADTYKDRRYDPSKPEGPVYYTFAKMAEFLNNYNFVKYGGLNSSSRDQDVADRQNMVSYLFKNKDLNNNPNLYMEVLWNKGNDGNARNTVTLPRRSNGDLGTVTIYQIDPNNSQGLVSRNIDPAQRTVELRGTDPVIVIYLADNVEGAPFGNVDSPLTLSPVNGWVNISGWAVSSNKAIDRVELHIDGVKRDELPYGAVRDDICRGANGHTKPDFQFTQCPFVGFGGNINMEIYRLPEGDHKLEVIAFDALGNRTILTWGGVDQRFGSLTIGGTTSTPVVTPTPSSPPAREDIRTILENFLGSGNGDQNGDGKINELDFGSVYSR